MTKRKLSKPLALAALLASGALVLFASGCPQKCEYSAEEICTGMGVSCTPDEPIICPNLSPIAYCTQEVPGSYMYALMIENRGEPDLIIESVSVMNDANSAIQMCGLSSGTVTTEMPTFLQFFYEPVDGADDQLWFEITSNATNFAPLIIPMCGRGGPMFDPTSCPLCECPSEAGGACPIDSPTSTSSCPIL